MHKNLENYLEEIGHFLSGRGEREEILQEIRSHILEMAEQEAGGGPEAALEKVIAAYGKPRQVAEKYLDGRPVIAPAYLRFLFRYTALLFAVHLAFTLFALVFKKSFVVFPFLFMPRLGVVDAVMYLPMAFLADFGLVALVLYLITRSGREIKLPWPKFAPDLDEVKPPDGKTLAAKIAAMAGAGIMLAITGVAVTLYLKYQTVFFVGVNFKNFRPLLQSGPGRWISLAVIALLAVGTIELFIKLFTRSRRIAGWANVFADAFALVMITLVLRQLDAGIFALTVPAKLQSWLHHTLVASLLVFAGVVAIDLVASLVRLGRGRLGR